MFALSFAGMLETAKACVCSNQLLNDREDAAAQFNAAAVVFEGEVLAGGREISSWNGKPGLSMIPFHVIHAYKGLSDESIEIYDSSPGTDCGFGEPASGTKFFVYGFKGKDDKIYIGGCSRTRTLDSAGPDIRFARGEPATKEDLAPPGEKWRLYRDPTLAERGASLKGVVRRADGGDVSEAFVTVWDVDESGRRNAAGSMAAHQKVSADGSFEIRLLAPGQYNVTAEDSRESPTARYVGEYGNVALGERQVLSQVLVRLHAEPLGTVRVRVIAPLELHDRVVVLLRDTNIDDSTLAPYAYSQTVNVDDTNVASFDKVPYGLYDVKVMLTGVVSLDQLWVHDDVRVQLKASHADTMVKLRGPQKE